MTKIMKMELFHSRITKIMKFIEFQCRIKKLMKTELVHARITKIMKFIKFNAKHLKIIKTKIIPLYNYEYYENHRIPHHNYETKKKTCSMPEQRNL